MFYKDISVSVYLL